MPHQLLHFRPSQEIRGDECMLGTLQLSSLGFRSSNVFSSHINGGHRFYSYTRTLGRVSGAGYSRPHLLLAKQESERRRQRRADVDRIARFRTGWDDEPRAVELQGQDTTQGSSDLDKGSGRPPQVPDRRESELKPRPPGMRQRL